MWFEEQQLMDYIQEHAHDDAAGFNLVSEDNSKGAGERVCHPCQRTMMKHQLIKHHDTEIDACYSCSRFWIDAHEIEYVQHSHTLKGALKEINQGFSWKSWFFEFIFRMPVEYNLKPKKTPWMTYSLILVNALIFLVQMLSPELTILVYQKLALVVPIENGAHFLMTLITAQFVHGGLLHIFGNMYFLWIIGDNVEDCIGKTKFLALYLLTGTVGMLLEVALSVAVDRPMLLMGASAAVSGLFGLYLVWFRHAKLSIMVIAYQFRLPAIWFFSLWLLINLLGFVSGQGGVAYLAHLGGFFAGLLFGFVLKSSVYASNPVIRLLNQ